MRQFSECLTCTILLNNSMTYYVYQLIDPRSNQIFYVGKGCKNRAQTHLTGYDGNNNPYKERVINKIRAAGLEPIIRYIQTNIDNESQAYDLEEQLIKQIGIENLTNICPDARPPSKKGWKPSLETLKKRSQSLKGLPRTNEWRRRLSEAKTGSKNPMYGKKAPCTKERRLSILRTKNQANYDLYKEAICRIDNGEKVDDVCKDLKIYRGVGFKLKNRSHGIFEAFPELK